MGNDNSLLIVVLAVVAYLFFIPPTGTKPKAGERYCPKGERYPATQWDLLFGCREGYDRKLFGDDCVCTAPIPSSIPDAANSPQTPAPSPQPVPGEYIPPGFIGKCKLWKDNMYWVLSGCDADDYNCVEYRPAKAVDYGMRACKS